MKTILLAGGLFLSAACGNASPSNQLPQRDSANKVVPLPGGNKQDEAYALRDTASLAGTWYLIPILPSDTVTGRLPSINFNLHDRRFSGNTGCNRMSGTFQFNKQQLQFDGRMISTKMVCPGYNEAGFLKSLLKVNNFEFENGELILRADGMQLSRWSRKPVKLSRYSEV